MNDLIYFLNKLHSIIVTINVSSSLALIDHFAHDIDTKSKRKCTKLSKKNYYNFFFEKLTTEKIC